jgi:magnesium chelatase accessory protein
MNGAPSWERDGRDWPHRESSRFVRAAGLRWHVQVMGQGPVLLLVHGTGASTHSWRALMPLLAQRFTVVAPDLPGHGFTESPGVSRISLHGMAEGLGKLLAALELKPALAVGHSAGAAVLIQMALEGLIAPRAVVGLNAALLPYGGSGSKLFSSLARAMVGLPVVPWLMAWRATDGWTVEKVLQSTGSRLDRRGIELYGRLFRSPRHVEAALGMMANWDLETLIRQVPKIPVPLVLVAAAGDRMVAPSASERVASLVRGARLVRLPGLGHLAHEEKPETVAELLLRLPELGPVATEA